MEIFRKKLHFKVRVSRVSVKDQIETSLGFVAYMDCEATA